MPNTLRYTVLSLGQGDGNLIELVEDDGTPIFLMLADLGSLGGREVLTEETVLGFVEERIFAQDYSMTQTIKIDVVIISHPDEDHYNLMFKLIERISQRCARQNLSLSIGKLYYSGERIHYKQAAFYSQKARDYILFFEFMEEFTNEVIQLDYSFTSFPSKGAFSTIFSGHGLNVYIISGGGKGTKIKSNDWSIISMVEYERYCIIHNADATIAALAKATKRAQRYLGQFKSSQHPPAIAMMTAPHHGAYNTVFGTYRALHSTPKAETDRETAAEVLLNYIDTLKPLSIVASSYEQGSADARGNRHPNTLMLEFYGKHSLDESQWPDPSLKSRQWHFASSNFNGVCRWKVFDSEGDERDERFPQASAQDYNTFLENRNVYTTLYFLGDERPRLLDEADSEMSDAPSTKSFSRSAWKIKNINKTEAEKTRRDEFVSEIKNTRKNKFSKKAIGRSRNVKSTTSFDDVATLWRVDDEDWQPDDWKRGRPTLHRCYSFAVDANGFKLTAFDLSNPPSN